MNGLWIPYDLIARDDLSHAERLVAAFIASFKRGFTGGNEYIATKLHLEKRTVDRVVASLGKKGIVVWAANTRFCVKNPTQ